jgi:hypothetical protein
MGSYLPLVSIAVEHMFYSQDSCWELEFVPTPKTTITLKNAGLLTRNTRNGIRIFYDEQASETLQRFVEDTDDPLGLTFKVFSGNRLFENFTELPIRQEDAILYFDNRGLRKVTIGKQRLHDEEYVSSIDFQKLDTAQLKGILNKKDRLVRPIFIVRLFVSEKEINPFSKQLKVIPSDYYIKFNSRQTFWKYYLLGKIASERSYIVDLNNETEFEFTGQESLSDNRTALTFKSKTSIPMRRTFSSRFQLKERGPGGEKVLIKRLPVASVGQIDRETINGEDAVVSEIYINF